MNEFKVGDRVVHVKAQDLPGTVVGVDEDGDVLVSWDEEDELNPFAEFSNKLILVEEES